MPTVPGLIPTAEPSTQGISEVGVNVDANAFGAGVGHAVASLGPVLEQAGDRIWQRAVEMQNLENETHAKNADSQFMLESAKMRADFVNKEGVNAGPAALKQHLDDLTKLRTDIRGGLTNPMAQKMYDSSSVSFMGREAFSAAAHSGQQMKVAANQADDARIASFHNDTANNPDDEVQFQRNTRAAAAAIEDKGHRLGWTDDVIKDAVRDDSSTQISARAVAWARKGNISGAEDLLDRARKQGVLTTKDGDNADNSVRTVRNAIGSANVAQSEYNSGVVDGKQTKSMKEVLDSAAATAEKQYPGDTIFAAHVRRETQNLYRVGISEEQNEKYRNVNIVTGLQTAGADTLQKLLADPEGAKAYMNLPETAKKSVQREYDTKTDVKNFAVAMGQSYDQDPNVKAKFMESGRGDFGSMDDTQWTRILQRRDAILKAKDKEADPRVPRALSWLRNSQFAGTMTAMNIYRLNVKDEFDQDNYHHFVGSLHDAIEDWQSINGKPPSQDDVVNKIGPMIIQQQAVHHWYRSDTKKTTFVEPTDAFRKIATMDRQNHGGGTPTEQELQRDYVRYQMRELYKAKKKSTDGQ